MLDLISKKSLIPSFDQMLESITNEIFNGDFKCNISDFNYPRIDVYESDTDLIIDATVPGLTKDDINISFDTKTSLLIVKLSKVKESNRDKPNYKWKEIHKSGACRTIFIPQKNFNVDLIDAKVENGLLTVSIPKRIPDSSEDTVKRINVN